MTRTTMRGAVATLIVAAGCAAGEGPTTPAAATQPAERPVTVYKNDFEKAAGRHWSSAKLSTTPKGGRKFLGEFSNDTVSLKLAGLPPHRRARISFELFIIRSWDGNDARPLAPDVLEVSLGDGRVLLRSTFCLTTGNQSFPDAVGQGSYPAATGAAEHRTLGFDYPTERNVNSVYKLTFLLPHTARTLTLRFKASDLEPISNESWGLDNVKVEVLPTGPPTPSKKQLDKLWRDLGAKDPVNAFAARWALIAAGDAAVDLLAVRLAERPKDDLTAKVAGLIKQLDDNKWRVREKATEELRKMLPQVRPQLSAALKALPKDASLELRTRLEDLLKGPAQSPGMPTGPALQRLRARHVLQVIGSAKAKALLKKLDAAGT